MFGAYGAFPTGTGKRVSGLLPGSWKKEYSLNESPIKENALINLSLLMENFMRRISDYWDGYTLVAKVGDLR